MLWNSVYDFFVMYVFGGWLGETHYPATIGGVASFTGGEFDSIEELTTADITAFHFTQLEYQDYTSYMSLGNYLSLIATIITIVIIVTLCALFIWKMVKLIGGLIR